MKHFICILFVVIVSCEPRDTFISDLRPFFGKSFAIDSLLHFKTVAQSTSVYNGKLSFLDFPKAQSKIDRDSGWFYIIDLHPNVPVIATFKNTFYEYMNLRSFLYKDTLFFNESVRFPDYFSYNLLTREIQKTSFENNKNHFGIHGASFAKNEHHFFYFGHPFGPSILNQDGDGQHISLCTGGLTMDPSYSTISFPLEEDLNLVCDCVEKNFDSINVFCINSSLQTQWQRRINYNSNFGSFFSIVNTQDLFLVCDSKTITALEKNSGKPRWIYSTDGSIINVFPSKNKLFLTTQKSVLSDSLEQKEINVVKINCDSGQQLKMSQNFVDRDAGISCSNNNEFVFITANNKLMVYGLDQLDIKFQKSYNHSPLLNRYVDGFDNSVYTLVDGYVFW